MKKEMGKWVLDVAKYLATAIIISTLFKDITEKSVILEVGGLSVAIMLLGGFFLIKDPKDKTKKT